MSKTFAVVAALAVSFTVAHTALANEQGSSTGPRIQLRDDWLLKSSYQMSAEGATISKVGFAAAGWHRTSVPTTVLSALTKNGVYPDVRVGMNSFKIPDASDAFNRKHDLAKYSHLPGERNPWKDAYWYRTEFDLPRWAGDRHLWLHFKGINYRAEVWLNGSKLADPQQMVGTYRRFRYEITDHARPGKNCLAVKVFPVDHPGEPQTQLDPLGKSRGYQNEIQKDVTYVVSVGYDCMPPIPDRNMGIWQDVYVESTGPVDIRDPFVATRLPLPKLSPASLTVSADLVNVTRTPQTGVCRGVVAEAGVEFSKQVELGPGETRSVVFSPADFRQLAVPNPRLWWPKPYGPQNLYRLRLTFETRQGLSSDRSVTFGIRQIGKELHRSNGDHGLRVLVNGQKMFCQGGWLQPELLFDMPAKRAEAEVRYLVGANLNNVTFEDIPVPCDEFLEACDRQGLMYWTCFYSTWWVRPETNLPEDHALLAECAVDVIKRYRNHPSVILYSCAGEGEPSKDIYLTWRKHVLELDPTRLFLPTVDVHGPLPWLEQDLPTGVRDARAFGWVDPTGYYERVRAVWTWMFNTEVSIATYPPVSSLRKFIPDVLKPCEGKPAPSPLDATWAHHDATFYMKDYDPAIRRLYGPPRNVEDYLWKAQLVSAAQHRAWSEAANHRMWDITSGVWQWKVNSCWPSVGWQIYDWYLKPLVGYYYYKSAFEPLHVQLSALDGAVTVVNRRLQAETGLAVDVRIYDNRLKLRWQKQATTDVGANSYRDVFMVPQWGPSPVYFVKLRMTRQGKPVSENFYWLTARRDGDFTELERLPTVKLNVTQRIENRGDRQVARVRLENPGKTLAFFIELAVTQGRHGEEVLPVLWDDNYFSLLPGESREVSADFATEDLHGAVPVVEVGGWNIDSPLECTALSTSPGEPQANRPFTVTAAIRNTFLDGGRVELWVDGAAVDSRPFWARGEKPRDLAFDLTLRTPGSHRLRVGNRTITVVVK
jgi:exo-1,4-beta-D-glucosaminidase